MRVLALADRPPPMDPARMARELRVQAVVCLGDLDRAWIEPLNHLRVPRLGVHGNHDEPQQLREVGVEDVHLKRVDVDGVSFSGFEGCVRYRTDGVHQYDQKQAAKLTRKLPPADVLLCHCPPFGINDDPSDRAHVGFEALRSWVERCRPRHLLHGHTHPLPGALVDRFGDTQVHYVAGARVVELD